MILLTTRHTKEKLEQALELSKKKENNGFEDVARLEGSLGSSSKRRIKPVTTKIKILQRHNKTLKT